MRASFSSPTPLLHAQQGRPASSQPRTVGAGTQPAAEEGQHILFVSESSAATRGQKQKDDGRGLQRTKRALVVHEGEERKDGDDKASWRGQRAELERSRLAASGGYDHDCEAARRVLRGA